MNNVLALAGVVIKELYRRKDFYVLFVLTALLTLMLGSVDVFNDDRIVRYLKDICLLLIWISSLVMAITTTARHGMVCWTWTRPIAMARWCPRLRARRTISMLRMFSSGPSVSRSGGGSVEASSTNTNRDSGAHCRKVASSLGISRATDSQSLKTGISTTSEPVAACSALPGVTNP